MIFYLTYNDLPSGIFSSQVIDVVNFYKQELNANVKLVSIISLRHFLKNKKIIIKECPDAIVLPMFPGVHRWKFNFWLLNFIFYFLKPTKIIGRSVLATQLALRFQKKDCQIIYDGRGAISAEWHEYNVVNSNYLKDKIQDWEKKVVLKADFRIAVSYQLIHYWQKEFNYSSNNHVIIPCTLNQFYGHVDLSAESILNSRKNLGLNEENILFVYSGSLAGWQSFHLLYNFIAPILISNPNYKILFLSDIDSNISKLQSEFTNQVLVKKILPKEVPDYLKVADYGILIREESITNKVASPVKFAEYLACGLYVIITNNLGDYTQFALNNKCGCLPNKFDFENKLTKNQLRELAIKYFTKNQLKQSFIELVKI
jgi:hypothetical protein